MTVLTFPSNPIVGQRYDAPNEIQYVFDGVKWGVETVASTSAAVTNSIQDRVAPMFVSGPNTGIAFTYNASTNVMSASVTAVNGNQLVNGVHEFTLESNGTLSLDNNPFTSFSGNYTDLSNKPTIPAAYTLPTATTSVLGGVKVDGTTVTITDGVISSVGGGGTTNKLVNGVNELVLGTDGVLTLPTGGDIVDSSGTTVLGGGTADTGSWTFDTVTATTDGNIIVKAGSGEAAWASLLSNNGANSFWVDDVGAHVTSNFVEGEVTENYWNFGTDGVLTLPQGSYIDETAAPLGTAKSLDLHPGNPGYPNQYLKIYPTGSADADHLHLTSGDLTATELFLGDDEQYVKLTNNGNVEIRTGAFDSYNSTKGVWTFDSDGALTLPTRNNTPGSRIKSAVDITIETGPYYLVDLHEVGGGSVVGGIGTLDFLISSAPDWATKVAVGDHVVSGTWTDIIIAVGPAGDVNRWTVTFASGEFTGNDSKWSFYKPGAAGGEWLFDNNGDLNIPPGGTIRDAMTGDDLLRYYDPDDTDHWNEPAINTISAALDELAARVTAFENFEIDGGNAYTPALGELLIDGYGA